MLSARRHWQQTFETPKLARLFRSAAAPELCPTMPSTSEIRQRFIDYFAEHAHRVVRSAPLVPGNDPTLLFTNAGMVQFKETFLGQEKRDYSRAVTTQRCVRAGGKHNDLDNVGYTARHHTFFEMLGNFSFGDYFKRDAIEFAWNFLTKELGLPEDKLWVTVFEEDDEAEKIWLDDLGVSRERFSRIGAKDNFWQMGDTGPCGPCSEIFYDHGPDVPGGPPGTPEEDGDRYIEIWNLVFMQYDRAADGTLSPLPAPSVDTGMGLERLAAVLQGVHSNYQIDLFQRLIAAAAKVAGCEDHEHPSLKVIADHIRATAFLITDGVLPSNEGRGFVLRRIMRRAIRHGYKLGIENAFFDKLVAPLVAEMGEAFPELAEAQSHVEQTIAREEARFAQTLAQGMGLLDEALASLTGDTLPGDVAFKLYDTYGFPVDLTADVCRERDVQIDMAGFEAEMDAQRKRARAASRFGGDSNIVAVDASTEFTGYTQLEGAGKVVALIANGQTVESADAGDEVTVVLDTTPFYAESGGQVGDRGTLQAGDNEASAVVDIRDTQKQAGGAHGHIGVVRRGSVKLGDTLTAQVDAQARADIVRNHSATHLLHAALRDLLGEHVQQKGSLVAPDRLRFDFSHPEPVTADELATLERRVNAQVLTNTPADVSEKTYDEAIAAGAVALFGEKYGDHVRVLRFGDFSTELCGGTHVQRLGDIGLFKIVSESGIASGVRRIEAVTGNGAVDWVQQAQATLNAVGGVLKAGNDELEGKARAQAERVRSLEKALEQAQSKLASSAGDSLSDQAIEIHGIKVLAAKLDGADVKALRETMDQLKNKLGKAIIVLGADVGGKVALIAGVTKAETARIKSGDLVNHVAQQVGGRGGGRPDMAQAGGSEPAKLGDALAGVEAWVRQQLAESA